MVPKTSGFGNLSERILPIYSSLSSINAMLAKRFCMLTGAIAIGGGGCGKILP
jgi:hypothetical protein